MGTFSNKVVGIFTDRSIVDSLLNDLNALGYDKGDISVLAKDHDVDRNREYETTTYRETLVTTAAGDTIIQPVGATTIVTTHDKDIVEDNNFDESHDVSDKDPGAMVKGATAGGAIGLVAGLGLLLVPGIGPVLAAGPLLAAITAAAGGAALGATAGTLIGILNDEGIPNDRSEFYTNHFNKGDTLVMVDADDEKKSQVREVFMKYNPNTVDSF